MASNDQSRKELLILAGEFFLDLIFYHLESLPSLGEELKTDSFAFSLGGGAAITAATAARLGRPSELITVFGDTAMDSEAQKRLADFQVGMRGSKRVSDTTSGLTVSVSTRSDRYFLTFPGANRFVESYLLSEAVFKSFTNAAHVHLALTPTRWEAFGLLLRKLKEHGVTTSWDLGWDSQAGSSPGFTDLWKHIDILFMNRMETLLYSGKDSLEKGLEKLSSAQNLIVVKLGKDGAIAKPAGSEPVFGAPVRIEATDTTGAGDAFNGGFLISRLNGSSLQECLEAGNICGALSTRAAGGVESLPSIEELNSYFNKAAG